MKKLIKKWYFWVGILIVLCLAFGGDTEDTSIPTTLPPATTTTTEVVTTAEDAKPENYIFMLEYSVEQGFPDNEYRVSFEDNRYVIYIWQNDLSENLSAIWAINDLSSWEYLKDTTENTTLILQDSIKTMSKNKCNYPVRIAFVDEANGKDTIFLCCENGKTIFDMAEAVDNYLN